MEGPVDAKEVDLHMAEWLPMQLGRLTEHYAELSASQYDSTLQQLVQCVDQWFGLSFALSFKYATLRPEQAPSDAQVLYSTYHKQMRSKTIAAYLLNQDGAKRCPLAEIYIPVLARVAQDTLLHVDIVKAQQVARWAIDIVHGCGLGWYNRLGWVLIPGGDGQQAERIFPSDAADAEQSWQLRSVTAAEAAAPEHRNFGHDLKRARNVLRQDALCAPFVVEVTTYLPVFALNTPSTCFHSWKI